MGANKEAGRVTQLSYGILYIIHEYLREMWKTRDAGRMKSFPGGAGVGHRRRVIDGMGLSR